MKKEKLKEKMNEILDRNIKYNVEIVDLQQENTQLKSVLKEIREYIVNNYDFYYGDELYDQYQKILEIIDKGIGE